MVSSSLLNDEWGGREFQTEETHKEVWQLITHSETYGVMIKMWALQSNSLCFNSEHITQLSVSPCVHLLNTYLLVIGY